MADPRNNVIYNEFKGREQRFSVAPCRHGIKKQSADASNRKSFFDSLGDIGNLEILNDIGFGEVAEGLRVLSGISDSVRIQGDTSAIPKVNDGGMFVFDAVGIDRNKANQVGGFHPDVANRAYSAAHQVWDRVTRGEFDIRDIPGVFSDLQNLSDLSRGIFTDRASDKIGRAELCGASPYARDLISYAPKYKFLFVVQFDFNAPYQGLSDGGKGLAFVVKHSSRPNINFDYEEVNMYNFRTKVPRRTAYEPMSMKFYDDMQNTANKFYKAYLEIMSPIARHGSAMPQDGATDNRVGKYELDSIVTSPDDVGVNAIAGSVVSATVGGAPTAASSASLGPLAQNEVSILRNIRIFHVFQYGKLMNVYNFSNPKITNMTLDDLDMADNGPGNEFDFQFSYDALHMEVDVPVEGNDLPGKTSGLGYAKYPLNPLQSVAEGAPSGDNGGSGNIFSSIGDTITDGISDVIDAGTSVVSATIDTISDVAEGAIDGISNTGSGAINASVKSGKKTSKAFSSASDFIGSSFT